MTKRNTVGDFRVDIALIILSILGTVILNAYFPLGFGGVVILSGLVWLGVSAVYALLAFVLHLPMPRFAPLLAPHW